MYYLIIEIENKGVKETVKLDLSKITVKDFIDYVKKYDNYKVIEYRKEA